MLRVTRQPAWPAACQPAVVHFGGRRPQNPAPAQLEIQRKIRDLKTGLDQLVAWDRVAHPQNPVILHIQPEAILKNARDFLQRQKAQNLRLIPYMIGIAGGTASGKTFTKTLLLEKHFPRQAQKLYGWDPAINGRVVDELMVDNYYKDFSKARKTLGDKVFFSTTNLDEPEALTMGQTQQTLQMIKQGITVFSPLYNMKSGVRTEKARSTTPAPFFLAEGLFTLNGKSYVPGQKQAFHQVFDLKIFVDTDRKTVIERWWRRAPSRNIPAQDRNNPKSGGWALLNNSFAMHDKHVAPSKRHAHLVLNGAAHRQALEATLSRLARLLLNAFYPFQQEKAVE